MIVVIVSLDFGLHMLAERRLDAKRAEIIPAQSGRVIIRVVDCAARAIGRGIDRARCRIELGRACLPAIGANVSEENGEWEIVRDVVEAKAEPADLVEAEILIILFVPVREIKEAGELCGADVDHALGIDLMLVLAAEALPFVEVEITIGKIGTRGIAASIDPHKTALGRMIAVGAVGLDAKAGRRIAREDLDRAAKIVGCLRAERACALRQPRDRDILGAQRATKVKAIVVAVILVTKRDAVEREAQPALVEPAHRDPLGPFIGTERIGRLEVDTWQLGQRLERARAGGENGDVALRDFLDLASRTAADDDDVGGRDRSARRAVVGRDCGNYGRRSGGRDRLRSKGSRCRQQGAAQQKGFQCPEHGFPPKEY